MSTNPGKRPGAFVSMEPQPWPEPAPEVARAVRAKNYGRRVPFTWMRPTRLPRGGCPRAHREARAGPAATPPVAGPPRGPDGGTGPGPGPGVVGSPRPRTHIGWAGGLTWRGSHWMSRCPEAFQHGHRRRRRVGERASGTARLTRHSGPQTPQVTGLRRRCRGGSARTRRNCSRRRQRGPRGAWRARPRRPSARTGHAASLLDDVPHARGHAVLRGDELLAQLVHEPHLPTSGIHTRPAAGRRGGESRTG